MFISIFHQNFKGNNRPMFINCILFLILSLTSETKLGDAVGCVCVSWNSGSGYGEEIFSDNTLQFLITPVRLK